MLHASPAKTAASEKSCCQKKAARHDSNCCRGDGNAAGAVGVSASTCCRPIVETPAPAVAAKKSSAPSQFLIIAAPSEPISLVPANQLWPTLLPATHATPPPLDAVIVFSRLTI